MTTNVIYGQEERLLPWVAERMGIARFRRDAYSIGVERDGELVGVVVYDTFSEADCCMHVASDGSGRWLTKEALVRFFAYPFVQLGLRRVTSPIGTKNAASMRFCEHLGFEREGFCRHGLPDDDVIVMGLIRENCRFIPQEHRNG
jgi:RimJ/RimL family protein N-acetyltransferase